MPSSENESAASFALATTEKHERRLSDSLGRDTTDPRRHISTLVENRRRLGIGGEELLDGELRDGEVDRWATMIDPPESVGRELHHRKKRQAPGPA